MGRESRNSRREADDEGTSSSVGAATGSRGLKSSHKNGERPKEVARNTDKFC